MDRSKTTPLHLAAENGHDRLILLLLENGANIAQEDAYGRNLLELAILRNQVMAFLCVKKYLVVLLFCFWGKSLPSIVFLGGLLYPVILSSCLHISKQKKRKIFFIFLFLFMCSSFVLIFFSHPALRGPHRVGPPRLAQGHANHVHHQGWPRREGTGDAAQVSLAQNTTPA